MASDDRSEKEVVTLKPEDRIAYRRHVGSLADFAEAHEALASIGAEDSCKGRRFAGGRRLYRLPRGNADHGCHLQLRRGRPVDRHPGGVVMLPPVNERDGPMIRDPSDTLRPETTRRTTVAVTAILAAMPIGAPGLLLLGIVGPPAGARTIFGWR